MSERSDQRETNTLARLTLVGLGVNFSLASIKLLAGLVGHSYALVADAIESIGDMVGSVVVWGGLKYGAKPADDDHPYGHGKAEALAAMTVAGLLLLAGAGIAVKSIDEILSPHHAPAWWTLIVLAAVVATKEIMFRISNRAAKRSGSTAVEVDSWHHRSDAITSFAAFLGISVALWGGKGWESADDFAALLASAVIIFNAVSLMRGPFGELMDKIDPTASQQVAAAAMTVEHVKFVEKIHSRKSGMKCYVDMHIQVAPGMSVYDAHIVSGKVKAAIKAAMPKVANVLIHIEPFEPPGGSSEMSP